MLLNSNFRKDLHNNRNIEPRKWLFLIFLIDCQFRVEIIADILYNNKNNYRRSLCIL
jgi:hypothetical protein